MSNGANSYVAGAACTQTETGVQIELTVWLDDFTPGETVEISGQATQSGGAFANYYSILTVPVPDGTGHKSVPVTSTSIPPNNFTQDQEIITVLRVSRVWVTVLGTQRAASTTTLEAAPGATWDNRHVVTRMDGSKETQNGS